MDPFRVKAINARWLSYWHQKKPLKKLNQIYRFGDLVFKLVFLSCLSTGRKKWHAYIPYAYAVLFYSSFVLTIWYYLGNDEFEKACYPICIFGANTMVTDDIELTFLSNCCISVCRKLSMQLMMAYVEAIHKPKSCQRLASDQFTITSGQSRADRLQSTMRGKPRSSTIANCAHQRREHRVHCFCIR